ncbi:MAG: alpha/beta hydrolase [Gemmatimonadaceae bacterium]|nr:alpha/beta hydrolase [Gemmatimonadaceae bacterium]
MSPGIRERVTRFGPQQSLVGILTTSKAPPSELPFVVIVNAGIVHRVGPNRLYVDMARSIAALGYPVLRFDLAGLGDSESVGGGASLLESAIHDVQLAMDHLSEERKASRFLIFGLCSGANYAIATAFVDPRVIGVMLVDPTVSRTTRSLVVHVVRRLKHMSTLRELVLLRHPIFHRAFGRRASAARSVAKAAEGQSGQRAIEFASQAGAAAEREAIEELIARGVQMMLVFTGGVNHIYNYHDQLFDLLPGLDFRQQLRLQYMPDTDHTVSDQPSRQRLLTSVGAWLQSTTSAGTLGAGSRLDTVSDVGTVHASGTA